ncbi:MAG: hypothetical protein IKU30_02155 [Clostridia bacterium]|nr:hypothetical protein [Clostridia bacterium]MBR6447923.1 hypothetical protein [Methanomicrobium sp.]
MNNIAPWNYKLPTALSVRGKEYPIRSDYRAALDIFLALTDRELDGFNKTMEMLDILYLDPIPPEDMEEAIKVGMWYLRGGEDEKKAEGKRPQLVSWAQDFNYIAAPISQVVGKDIRGLDYFHWWSFLSAYMGIGDCLFAQIVRIREKLAMGKSLDKTDRAFYRKNRDIIDIKKPLTGAEEQILKEWM